MAKLTGQTIASSYDQLLIVDHADGISSSLQAIESADTGGSSSALKISTVGIEIDTNLTATTTATTKGTHIDFDATGITASGQTATNIGLDLDMNSNAPTMVGTVVNTGIDLDMVGGTSGTQTNVGLDVNVSGADTNYAALFNGGNVGIGTTSPSRPFEITSSGDGMQINANTNHLIFGNTSETPKWYTYLSGNDFRFYDSTDRITFQSGGNVGIGTAAPATKLHIEESTHGSDITFRMRAENDAGAGRTINFTLDPDARTLAVGESGEFVIKEGNVGIGTAVPDGTLHVHTATGGTITPNTAADDLIVENSADGGISILNPDASWSSLYFGSPSDNDFAWVRARENFSTNVKMEIGTNQANGYIQFISGAGTDALSIDSSGNTDHNANYIVNEQGRQNHVANTMPAPYYRFDGVDDTIDVADSAHLSFGDGNTDIPFSISAWINMEDATSFPIANKGTYNSDGEWQFVVESDDKLYFNLFDESVASCLIGRKSVATLTSYEGKWIHVAGTYSGSSADTGLKLYINGVQVADATNTGGSYVAMENLADEVRIGNYNDASYARGSIAGLKIWNLELSATEVKEDYSGASVPFKYVHANNTLLNTGTAANTGSFDTFGSASLAGYSASNSSASGSKAVTILLTGANLKKGDYVGLTINHTTFANVTVTGWKIAETAGSGNSYTSTQTGVGSGISHTTNLVIMDSIANPFLRITYSTASNTDIVAADIKLIRIGAVAEYDGSSAGAHQWGDKSGNALHGTVGDGAGGATAPTLENTPYDSGTEYEEGTWTPVIGEYADAADLMTMGGDTIGTYTRIGDTVTVWGYAITTGVGSHDADTAIALYGLPYTSANNLAARSGMAIGSSYGLNITAGHTIGGFASGNTTKCYLLLHDVAAGYSALTRDEWSVDGAMSFSLTYKIA